MPRKLCLDRLCTFSRFGAHFEHKGIAIHDFLSIVIPDNYEGINWRVEELKAMRGYTCVQCNRALIPTDKDHAFCEDCWAYNMEGAMKRS